MTQPFALQVERNGVYHLPAERHLAFESLAQGAHQKIESIDLSRRSTLAGALKKIGTALSFPAWYGVNLDALFDCLTDPECQAGRGCLISITGTHRLAAAQPEAFSTLLDVLQSAAETLRDDGTPFWVLVDTPGPTLNALPEA